LYEIKLYPEAHGKVATVFMRWEDPDTHQIVEISQDYNTNQIAFNFEEADPYFQRAVVVAEYAEILKGSYWAEESSMDDVYDEARRIDEYMYRDNAMEEFVDLVREARRLIN
jgi:Ca-activated chloride channel family protein